MPGYGHHKKFKGKYKHGHMPMMAPTMHYGYGHHKKYKRHKGGFKW